MQAPCRKRHGVVWVRNLHVLNLRVPVVVCQCLEEGDPGQCRSHVDV